MSPSARARILVVGLVVVWSAACLASAADVAPSTTPQQGPPVRLEYPDMPPAPEPIVRPTLPPLPPGALLRDTFLSIQANVDPNGNNIPGDAANEPSIAVDPVHPYRIVIGWRQFNTISSNFRQGGWAYSTDAGHHWTFPGVLENNVFRSDPVLGADSNGNFYYLSLKGDFTQDMFRSLDGGKTWPQRIPAFGGDKEWFTIDRTGGSSNNFIYSDWSTAAGPFTAATFTRSVSGGIPDFGGPYPFPTPPIFGTLTVDPNGTLYCGGIDAPSFFDSTFVVAKSTNAKNPLVAPTFTTTIVNMNGALLGGGGPNPDGLLGQVWIAADNSTGPTRGNVYMLCSVLPFGSSDPLDIHFVRSTNGGQSWSTPVRVNDDPLTTNAWQWFGTMSVAPNGRIDAIWNDTRNDVNPSNPTTSELFYSFSTDAGVTWAPNVAVSPPFNHFLGYPQQNKIGDYYGMVSDSVGANVAYAATFNGEQDVYFMRIGDYDCNGNGIPDTQDVANGTLTDVNQDGIPDQCQGLGDMNCDGAVNFGDINPFVLALTGQAAYQAQFPNCKWLNGDTNGDGTVNFADINPFVTLLTH